MWFGTNGGGLCSFDPKTEAFIEFDSALPNKVIYSIEQDQTGDFWISSNAGIFKINPISKAHFRQFTINDGLQGNQFMARSSLKSSVNYILAESTALMFSSRNVLWIIPTFLRYM